MSSLRSGYRPSQARPASGKAFPIPAPVEGALVVLSLWAIGYEVACAAFRSVANDFPFAGIAPDIAFASAGALIIARSFKAERRGR